MTHAPLPLLLTLSMIVVASPAHCQTSLTYVSAPADNPLKGLVPYARPAADRFPHSMEFNYLPLSDVMTGPDTFEWGKLEKLLNDIASRRHQAVFRIWLEYPGRKDGIPAFLEKNGLQVTEWLNTNTEPFPQQMVRTPDYSNPALRAALKSFITALGNRYDGDPRIGFITAGLLGTWGEWHTYPHTELMASKEVQTEVLDAFEAAFRKSPVLLRYPAGVDTWAYAPNHLRNFGYHDDSFAWATLDTEKNADHWFYMPALKAAGPKAINKWKTCPIGGEIRPDLWGQIFDKTPAHKQAQDFAECVRQTHATWLMDTGMFQNQQPPARFDNAVSQVQKMGYEFHIVSSHTNKSSGKSTITIEVRNTGVAPFYHNWNVEFAALDHKDKILRSFPVTWKITGLLPAEEPRIWTVSIPESELPEASYRFAVRVANPLPNGIPLRFANEPGLHTSHGWFRLP